MNSQPRGFAMLMAVGMVGLLAAVLLGMTMLLAADARRTEDVEVQVQLDQLLLTGATLAVGQDTSSGEISLPPELREQGATLRIERSSQDDTQRVIITATIDRHVAQQTLHLKCAEDGWEIIDATR